MFDSVWPHRWQPTRLPHPWDSPGKNTRVACHFLLQCMKVKSEIEVAQSCPTLRDLMDSSPPGSSIHRIFQARALEWGAIAFSPLWFLRGILWNHCIQVFNSLWLMCGMLNKHPIFQHSLLTILFLFAMALSIKSYQLSELGVWGTS